MNEDKRKLEEDEEEQVGAKKQKNDDVAAVEEQKIELKISETEVLKRNVLFPPKKELLVAAKNCLVDLIEKEDEISGSAEDAGAPEKVPGTATKNDLVPATKKKDDASNGTGSVSEDEDVAVAKNVLAAGSSGEDPTATKKEGERSKEESDPPNIQGIKKSISISENSNSLEESPEEYEEISADKETEDPSQNPVKMPRDPATLRVETTGSKTLFIGNLCFSIERTDVEEFFKDAGEIVDIRFAMNEDDTFRGFGHIEFATVEAAEKQALLELNGKHLLGRRVRLDYNREKGSYTPHSSTGTSSSQTGWKAQEQTIFIRGFDKRNCEDKIRSALGDHFVSCGEITKISIPRDQDGGVKGIAYIDFKDANAFNNALELNGSELGEATLTVEGARPRGDGRDSAWSGRSGGGRFGGRHVGGRGYGYGHGDHFGGGGHGYGHGGHFGGLGRDGYFGGSGRGYGGHFGGDGRRGYGGNFGGDGRGYGGHFGGDGRGYGGHFGGDGRGYGGHFGGDGRGYGGHFGGDGRGYGGHFGGDGRGYGGRFGGDGRGYSGWFGGGGRGW
ncbi:heterogeneous nuclear ribonucleoprotein A3 homolog 1-like isoform X3 [Olea europaea var. sylvestris]|uniref:heterogeneous nuclear ribonucleoprotein A3 homolog 1-like isoform X3 n=1 Tax=Olea europaea var. sylvestris TaxID=158386 RepID=UPI000C1CF0FD|nr:heterogeneous nuclear ribonucleoprotein A3 homolog 1-like isoform X3 [Olea europaea var. sylvestris]